MINIYSHLGFFLMSSNWPTTWDTFVLTILNAISSSPMISNLSSRGPANISKCCANRGELVFLVCRGLTCTCSGL